MKKVDVIKTEKNINTISFILCIVPLLSMFIYGWYAINDSGITFQEAREVEFFIFNIGLINTVISGVVLPIIGHFYVVYKNRLY